MSGIIHNKIISVTELWKFFNDTANFFGILSPEGYLTQANPYLVRILGFSEEQLLSLPFQCFVHEDDHERLMNQLQRLKAGAKVVQFCTNLITEVNGVRLVWWTATSVEEDHQIYLIGQTFSNLYL